MENLTFDIVTIHPIGKNICAYEWAKDEYRLEYKEISICFTGVCVDEYGCWLIQDNTNIVAKVSTELAVKLKNALIDKDDD